MKNSGVWRVAFVAVVACLMTVTTADSDPYGYHYTQPYHYAPDYTQYYYTAPAYDYYGGYAKTDYNRYPGGVYWNLNEYGPSYTHYQMFEQNVAKGGYY